MTGFFARPWGLVLYTSPQRLVGGSVEFIGGKRVGKHIIALLPPAVECDAVLLEDRSRGRVGGEVPKTVGIFFCVVEFLRWTGRGEVEFQWFGNVSRFAELDDALERRRGDRVGGRGGRQVRPPVADVGVALGPSQPLVGGVVVPVVLGECVPPDAGRG